MNGVTGVCRMCGRVKQLINAHIIPRKFFEGIRGTHKYAVQVDSSRPLKGAGTFYQAGIADKKVLCEECERRFGDFDTYGWKILGKLSLNVAGSSFGFCGTSSPRNAFASIAYPARNTGD
jgi:hypothetical protein